MDQKFDDLSVRQVAELLGITREAVTICCREHGCGYRLSPTMPWRIPRERIERLRAEREAAVRA